jgi:non-ribosomal peptide synthetase component E (peptide arylation enzyme)
VAAVGMPDKEMGERICVFVVPQPGQSFTIEELREFLLTKRRVAKFKLPERLELIDELPVTKIGKFEKKSLRERITKMLVEEERF